MSYELSPMRYNLRTIKNHLPAHNGHHRPALCLPAVERCIAALGLESTGIDHMGLLRIDHRDIGNPALFEAAALHPQGDQVEAYLGKTDTLLSEGYVPGTQIEHQDEYLATIHRCRSTRVSLMLSLKLPFLKTGRI